MNSIMLYSSLFFFFFSFSFFTIAAKVFPGKVTLNDEFASEMDDRASKLFQETAEKIEKAVRD